MSNLNPFTLKKNPQVVKTENVEKSTAHKAHF